MKDKMSTKNGAWEFSHKLCKIRKKNSEAYGEGVWECRDKSEDSNLAKGRENCQGMKGQKYKMQQCSMKLNLLKEIKSWVLIFYY